MAENSLEDAIEEAVAAFDSANLAWGQFYQNMLPRRPADERLRAQAVRAALGEAALDVPRDGVRAEVQVFVRSLEAARASLLVFLGSLPAGAATGDILQMPETLQEAAEILTPYIA
ncbi:MAG: hypothetical protein ACR2PL_10295 [Dehalococcoidia bacterium]